MSWLSKLRDLVFGYVKDRELWFSIDKETSWTGYTNPKYDERKPMESFGEMHLRRVQFSPASTIGQLWIENWLECYTLEDCVRKTKIPKVTAIPAGRYEVVIDYSERWKRPLPHLLNVPEFTGIRIHPGNTSGDTEGCILPGQKTGIDSVSGSAAAFNALYKKIETALSKGKLYINITDDFHPT